jgi:SAM-dependent methyltransferase
MVTLQDDVFCVSKNQSHLKRETLLKASGPHVLIERRKVWASKPIIRRLYRKWYGLIEKTLRPGRTIELGGGSGVVKEFLPEVITTDIAFAPWLDAVMDAHALPFKEESMENIVLFDVLHHLAAPAVFFGEVERVLRPKGRLVIMEPYVSMLSFPIYLFLHAEGMDWRADPFEGKPNSRKEPFKGNQAIPKLVFEKHRKRFSECFPHLKMVLEEKMDSFLYPLSGGFHHPSLCPMFAWNAVERLEGKLGRVNKYIAFRIFVVLEKG